MASILLSDLHWATPDGRTLFSGLNLAFGQERVGLVGRNGAGKSTLLRLIAGELQPAAGAISVKGTMAVLRQQLAPAPGASVASLFGAGEALALLRTAERGEADADQLAECDWLLETRLAEALARVGLTMPADTLLERLSGGERTRAAVAALLFGDPDFLLLDEPTNHLDGEGRAAIAALLAGWRGGAIIASHDRALLEGMDAIVELGPHGARRHGGGWSAYRAQKAEEAAAAEQGLADAERRLDGEKRVAARNAEKQARRDAAGRRKGAKGDMPKILLGMRRDRAEGTAGGNARIAESRISAAGDALAEARERVEIVQPLTVAMPPSGLSAGRRVADVEGVSARSLRGFDLAMVGPERIAVTGPNGSGKSTLLALLAGLLAPEGGDVRVHVPAALLDQDVRLLDPALSIRDNFMALNPGATENDCRAALARFRFRADAALQPVAGLSGGERLRAGLACVLGVRPPQLLLLDEPTNHLDIDSVEAVEAGLCGYDGALVVVSHDMAFLDAIAVKRWIAL